MVVGINRVWIGAVLQACGMGAPSRPGTVGTISGSDVAQLVVPLIVAVFCFTAFAIL